MRVRLHLIALAVIAVLTLVLVVKVRRDPPCAVDEPGWLRSGGITYQLVVERASPAQWETAYGDSDFDNRNPPIGKLVVGGMLAAAGVHRPNYKWTWPLSYRENLALGTLPPPEVLRAVRLGFTLVAAITLVLTYCIAWRLTRSAWAIAAPVYLFSLPVFQFLGARVYTDIIEVTLMLASGLAALIYVEQPRRWTALVVAAVAAGLACATKFSAAPLVIGLAFVVGRISRFRLLAMAIAVLVPVLVFVAVNPYLYRTPVTRTRGLIIAWGELIGRQQVRSPGFAVQSRLTKLKLVATRTIFPERFEGTSIGLRLVLPVILLVGLYRVRWPWLTIVVVQAAVTALWLPFDWQPYYLPTLGMMAPAFAAGLQACERTLSRATTAIPGLAPAPARRASDEDLRRDGRAASP
jgi:dolichyl-phosphate-mannose-protein mannosyltransferase